MAFLSNTVDIQEMTFDDKYAYRIVPKYNGGLFAEMFYDGITATGSTTRYYCNGIIYEDGQYRYDDESKNQSSNEPYNSTGYETDRLYRIKGTSSLYSAYTQAYLGTICNLSSPVVKTSAQSMKVTYTLTDI